MSTKEAYFMAILKIVWVYNTQNKYFNITEQWLIKDF